MPPPPKFPPQEDDDEEGAPPPPPPDEDGPPPPPPPPPPEKNIIAPLSGRLRVILLEARVTAHNALGMKQPGTKIDPYVK